MEKESAPESENEVEPQIAEREAVCARLFERGLDDPTLCGLHGTSLEALQQLIVTGHLPTGDGLGNEGFIYFYRPQDIESGLADTTLEGYAEIHAFQDRFAGILGLDRQRDAEFLTAMWNAFDSLHLSGYDLHGLSLDDLKAVPPSAYGPILDDYVSRLGLNKVLAAAVEASKRTGVIIGLGETIGRFEPESVYESGDEGHRIRVSGGLPLEDIVGLEPIGQPEYDYLEAMQRRVDERAGKA